MANSDDLADIIVETAQFPKREQSGTRIVEEQDIGAMATAMKALREQEAGNAAAPLANFGLRFTRLIPPGGG